MSIINDNPLVLGARGNFGKKFVYRKHGNDTLITRMPALRPDAEPTEKQSQVRDLFSEAAVYAKGAVSSEDLKKEYGKKAPPGKTAYNMAFRDYLKPPVVKSIDALSYKGTPGSNIVIKAKDDFRVAEVKVSIHTAAGVLVEEGSAVLDPIRRNLWNYAATQNNATLAGSVITATAADLPGNKGTLEVTL